MKKPFESLDAFYVELNATRAERDVHGAGIVTRWEQLKDPVVRGMLVKDAVMDVIRSTKPGRRLHDLMSNGLTGTVISTLGLAFANTRSGLGKRLLFSGISLLLGKLMRPADNEEDSGGILSNVATIAGRFFHNLRERKAAHEAMEHAEEPDAMEVG
jgi:hypothetical protein